MSHPGAPKRPWKNRPVAAGTRPPRRSRGRGSAAPSNLSTTRGTARRCPPSRARRRQISPSRRGSGSSAGAVDEEQRRAVDRGCSGGRARTQASSRRMNASVVLARSAWPISTSRRARPSGGSSSRWPSTGRTGSRARPRRSVVERALEQAPAVEPVVVVAEPVDAVRRARARPAPSRTSASAQVVEPQVAGQVRLVVAGEQRARRGRRSSTR